MADGRKGNPRDFRLVPRDFVLFRISFFYFFFLPLRARDRANQQQNIYRRSVAVGPTDDLLRSPQDDYYYCSGPIAE